MTERITIADVARAAGVSMMTVSRAINNKEGVSAATRARILEIAQQMAFQPNSIAQSLASNRTATIGLVVPDIANPFFAEIARGVEDVAYVHDYNVFLLNSNESVEREEKALESLLSKQVDGLIWCSSRLSLDKLSLYLPRFAYTVLINRTIAEPMSNVIMIDVDDAAGAAQAVAHFVQHGRRKVALLAGPSHSVSGQKRRRGFLAACEQLGLAVDESHIRPCDPTSAGGYEVTLNLLQDRPQIDAILAYNDLVAVGVLQACYELGRRVPEEMTLIGFDDIPLAALVTPSLSTLRIDKYDLGERGMQTLLQLLNQTDGSAIVTQMMRPELILRESTAR
ncbi:MAG: LacI family DNA-binding transcriptional regulator [Anaerolineales bacterium]|nr:LacI family DNA-binding transcriptional regulator [Anaerolineales bacterium]